MEVGSSSNCCFHSHVESGTMHTKDTLKSSEITHFCCIGVGPGIGGDAPKSQETTGKMLK